MKKIIALLLAMLMLLSFAACGGTNNETTAPDTTEETTEAATEETTEGTTESGTAAQGLDSISLTYGQNLDNIQMMNVYNNGDGTYSVDYMGQIRKVGSLDAAAMETIDQALQSSGLLELNGQSEYQEGEASGSYYVSYADGTMYSADFSGVVPEAFLTGFTAMDTCFQSITADIPEYVPEPMLVGEVAESDRAALDAILANMTLDMPDSYMISGVAKDEYFASTVGLSSDEGIASGVSFSAMMMTTAYALNIVTVEDGTSVDTVAEDFNTTLDWAKWVCVMPSNALIATKDNQVLCLMGSDDLYNQTVSAIEAAGWTTVQSLTNPDM